MALTPTDRVRRFQRICWHFARNIAYYRAARGDDNKLVTPETKFWRVVNSDFVDVAVLEWCKLLGDKPSWLIKSKKPFEPSRHSWEYIVGKVLDESPSEFRKNLLEHLKLNESQFEEHRIKVRVFRDKFVAHLDDENIMHIPHFDVPLAAVFFLFNHVTARAKEQGFLIIGDGIEKAYEDCLAEAKQVYAKAG